MKLQLLLYAFTATVLAAPTEHVPSVVHEKRYVHPGRERGARIDGTSVTSFRIALTQRNLDKGYDHLMSVSHPSSPNYGKLWTAEDVRKTCVNRCVEGLLEQAGRLRLAGCVLARTTESKLAQS